MHCMGEFQKTNEQDVAHHTIADPLHLSPYVTFVFEIRFRILSFHNYFEGLKKIKQSMCRSSTKSKRD